MSATQVNFVHKKRGILSGIRNPTQDERDFFYRNLSKELGEVSLVGCIDGENGLEYIVHILKLVGCYYLLRLGEEMEYLRVDLA
ncbi:MAG: hypothetical protein PHX25_03975 [Candidatus Pacebacteria bacterium]|nr:hypothetical protein [Candidatus Paceibacterota bacterium]